ncbi:MAG: GntR family transcriptional regulator [Gaiellaceae bacterium]
MSENWLLPTIERTSTIEQVHRTLRDAIVEGEIPEGSRLGEVRLARMLGTSRGTVREAIRHLVQEGIVETKLHRGASVAALSSLDRLDVYMAREAIEVWAARWLVEQGDGIDLRPLEEAMEELRAAAVGEDRPTERVIAADIRFHRELVGLTGSPRLARAYETLAAEARMLLRHQPAYPWRKYVSDHETLFEALERRDPRAPDLVAEHLRLSADLIRGEITGVGHPAARSDGR